MISSVSLTGLMVIIAALISPDPAAGFGMKLIPIDSLRESPPATPRERHQRLAGIALARARRYNKAPAVEEDDYSGGLKAPLIGGLNNEAYFATRVLVGTEAGSLTAYLLVDTGSAETWIQCVGCSSCFTVLGGSFHYRKSPSYKPLPYDDSLCFPKMRYRGSNATCGYNTAYSEGQVISSGQVGVDVFFFTDSTSQSGDFFDVAFGCGLDNKGVPIEFGEAGSNVISGVLGLALGGPRAFLQQVRDAAKYRFSYCLPLTSMANTSATLFFGDDAQISGAGVQTMPMRVGNACHLFLDSISVNGSALPIDPVVFEYHDDVSQGFFIDSGSPLSVLAQAAYDVLRDAMVNYFSHVGVHPKESEAPFDLCFATTPSSDQLYPQARLRFQNGAELVLRPDSLFMTYIGEQGFCMTILPTADPGPSLLGAWQQSNYLFLYDLQHQSLSFVPKEC